MFDFKNEYWAFDVWFEDTKYYGLVVGRDSSEIFEAIDESGWGLNCLIKPAAYGGVFYKSVDAEEIHGIELSELEISDQLARDGDNKDGWVSLVDWLISQGWDQEVIEKTVRGPVSFTLD